MEDIPEKSEEATRVEHEISEEAREEPQAGERAQEKRTYYEERVVRGEQLWSTIEELLRESTVRRIRVINGAGRVVIDIPVWAAAVGGAAAIIALPILSAIGVIGGLLAGFKVEIEREVGA
ncbi:MAG: DUF4342 domain-containing protein [Firmicutes bacterium]|nr:DUF4342 domain-containing protein [Bacillota bacterium]